MYTSGKWYYFGSVQGTHWSFFLPHSISTPMLCVQCKMRPVWSWVLQAQETKSKSKWKLWFQRELILQLSRPNVKEGRQRFLVQNTSSKENSNQLRGFKDWRPLQQVKVPCAFLTVDVLVKKKKIYLQSLRDHTAVPSCFKMCNALQMELGSVLPVMCFVNGNMAWMLEGSQINCTR